MEDYSKTLHLGKIDFYGKGRKINDVTIELNLKNVREGLEFTASGFIWNSKKTDCVCGGQCIDTIAKYFSNDKTIQRIKEIWERWHLNDFHAGCEHQRQFESEPFDKHRGHHCDICNYTYGTGWKFEKIPDNIIKEILSF